MFDDEWLENAPYLSDELYDYYMKYVDVNDYIVIRVYANGNKNCTRTNKVVISEGCDILTVDAILEKFAMIDKSECDLEFIDTVTVFIQSHVLTSDVKPWTEVEYECFYEVRCEEYEDDV